jgi:hypothetical protein
MQLNERRSMEHSSPEVLLGTTGRPTNGTMHAADEFAEPVPEYLKDGYGALMQGEGFKAIAMMEVIFKRYPSAEVCAHLARAHYYQTFFLNHPIGHPQHAQHIRQMRLWAERALSLNPHSSMGHAMLAGAIGRQAQISGSIKEIIRNAWQVKRHADCAVKLDNNWLGHFVLGILYREVAAVHPGLRALARLLQIQLPEASYQKSIDHFNEVLRQYPDNNTIYAEIAITCEKMGDRAGAMEAVNRFKSMKVFKHPIAGYVTDQAAARFRQRGYPI